MPLRTPDTIPVIDSTVFVGYEQYGLATGLVAVGHEVLPGRDHEYEGYLHLRGNVYAHEKHFMPVEDLRPDGTELDADDIRSAHFAVIQNAATSARVVGAMRIIVKSHDDMPLPVEEHYPEAFLDGPAPRGSAELSRLIGRLENKKDQGVIKQLLFAAAVSYGITHELGPAYGAVEPSFQRALRIGGVPNRPMAPSKFIPEFNARKQPVEVDIQGLTNNLRLTNPELLDSMITAGDRFVYSTSVKPVQPAGRGAVA